MLLAACFGGRAGRILNRGGVRFITAQFTQDEAREKIPKLLEDKPKYRQAGLTEQDLFLALDALPVEVFTRYHYKSHAAEAEKQMSHIDPKDAELFALALRFDAVVWSNDPHFKKIGITCWTTEEMLEQIDD